MIGISSAQLLVTRFDRVLHRTVTQTLGEQWRQMGNDPRGWPHRHVLTKTIGPSAPAPAASSNTFEVGPGDRIVIASNEPTEFAYDEDVRAHANRILASIDSETFAYAVVAPVT